MADLLIVDDDEDFSGAFRVMLQSRGYDVAMETEPKAVLPRLNQKLPDALILDVMFPEDKTAGFTLAREIRKEFPDLPILIITSVKQAFSLEGDEQGKYPDRLPVTGYVQKPVDFPDFCMALDRLLRRPTIYLEGKD